jgi:hypothetical protein
MTPRPSAAPRFWSPASRFGRAASSAFAIVAALTIAAGPAVAATPPAYSDIPTTVPGNVSSIGFEATATSEFGDLITLEGTDRARAHLPMTVIMSSHACQSDANETPTPCTTTPGATFSAKLTLTLYDGTGGGIGAKILSTTKTVKMPYRPSWDQKNCTTSGGWSVKSGSEFTCYSGQAVIVTFALPAGKDLPDEFIWTISYSTAHYGPTVDGVTGKEHSPMNSLNVGAKTFEAKPYYGTRPAPDTAIDDSVTGVLHVENDMATYAPLACFGLTCPGQKVGGITGTPPPTSTAGTSGNESPLPLPAVLPICLAFGLLGLIVAAARRRPVSQRAE